MAADYDELRTDVKENQEQSLQALQSASAPTAKSVVLELDETDGLDANGPGGEIVAEELIIQVIPQANDEFTCNSCFLVRHRSQIAREKDGVAYCPYHRRYRQSDLSETCDKCRMDSRERLRCRCARQCAEGC